MKNPMPYALATLVTLSLTHTKPVHAICADQLFGTIAAAAISTGGTVASIGGVMMLENLRHDDIVASTGGAVAAAGVLLLLPTLLVSTDATTQECHREAPTPTPTARLALESTYLGSLTNHGRAWPEMSIAHCRGLGFERYECERTLVPAWNEDRTVLQQMITNFFQRFNEDLSRLETLTPSQRRTLATQFITYVDEEILPYVSDATVRILHAIGRGLIARFHESRVTAGRRNLELPLGASPVYVAPNGVGFHF